MSEVPTGVKVIAVLNYIGAVLLLLLGLGTIAAAGVVGGLLASIPLLGALGAGLFVVMAIILIALAVLCFFVGRGLWKGQKWARIISIIFAILGVLSAIVNLVQGNFGSIVSLVISGLIGGYLLFSKKVKEAFA